MKKQLIITNNSTIDKKKFMKFFAQIISIYQLYIILYKNLFNSFIFLFYSNFSISAYQLYQSTSTFSNSSSSVELPLFTSLIVLLLVVSLYAFGDRLNSLLVSHSLYV